MSSFRTQFRSSRMLVRDSFFLHRFGFIVNRIVGALSVAHDLSGLGGTPGHAMS